MSTSTIPCSGPKQWALWLTGQYSSSFRQHFRSAFSCLVWIHLTLQGGCTSLGQQTCQGLVGEHCPCYNVSLSVIQLSPKMPQLECKHYQCTKHVIKTCAVCSKISNFAQLFSNFCVQVITICAISCLHSTNEKRAFKFRAVSAFATSRPSRPSFKIDEISYFVVIAKSEQTGVIEFIHLVFGFRRLIQNFSAWLWSKFSIIWL